MRNLIRLGTVLVLLLAAPSGWAQKPPAVDSGLLPLDELNLFPKDKLSAEVNIEGALLRLVAQASKRSDPDFSSLLAGLRSIKVQVFPLAGAEAETVKVKIGRAVRWLEDHNWQTMMKVREEGSETYIYLKEQDGKIVGLTVLSFTPGEEAAVINIAGRIDPEQLGRLGQGLDVPQLQKLPAPGGKKPQ
jgi:Domain of unknown function (DUF4252)